MEKIKRLLCSFFKLTWKCQIIIVNFSNKKRKLDKYIDIVEFIIRVLMLFSMILIMVFKINLILLLFILTIIRFSVPFYENIEKTFTSAYGFIKYGLLLDLFLTAIIINIMSISFKSSNLLYIFLFWAVFSFFWLLFSLLANNKISTLINGVISGINTIIFAIINIIINMLPSNIQDLENFKHIDIPEGYSFMQMLTISLNIIILAPLTTNIIAIIMCLIKSYWIEKYNNGNDINYTIINTDNIEKSI